MNELEPLLGRWANFYLSMTSAAASLIGLLFVVITLAVQQGVQDVKDTSKIHAYLTPTVVYFASVLIVSALLSFPNQTALTATLCICIPGLAGLVYSGSSLVAGKKRYDERSDAIVYAILPFAAYALLVIGGILALRDPQRGLTFAAVGMLSLLTIGIRNSWAVTVDVVSNRRR